MQIIPVIDLKDGNVVYAQRGERDQYQAIALHSKLCLSSDIFQVIEQFLQLYTFKTFYIADINAICSGKGHTQLLNEVLQVYPQLHFWIDQGLSLVALNAKSDKNFSTVIGTESQQQAPIKSDYDYILSLDYNQHSALGHSHWFSHSQFWPNRIIVMTLNRVGSRLGPDNLKLAELCRCYPKHQFIAAGGVRDVADLKQLKSIGVSGVLLSTALHDLSIAKQDIINML